jgi:hypothetical protein
MGGPRPVLECTLQRSHIVQYRIDSGMEKIHDFVGSKGAVAALLSLWPRFYVVSSNETRAAIIPNTVLNQ